MRDVKNISYLLVVAAVAIPVVSVCSVACITLEISLMATRFAKKIYDKKIHRQGKQ